MPLADSDYQCMELIEQGELRCRWIMSEGVSSQLLQRRVLLPVRSETVAHGNTPEVFIDHHRGVAKSVNQDNVGRLLADAKEREQLRAQARGRLRRQRIERA